MKANRETRLRRLEQSHLPQSGALPCTVVLPPDATAAERAVILADVARREAMGQHVVVVSSPDEAFDALVEAFAP